MNDNGQYMRKRRIRRYSNKTNNKSGQILGLLSFAIFIIIIIINEALKWIIQAKRTYRGLAYQYNYNIKEKNMNQKEQLKLAGEQIDELFKVNEGLIKKLATNTIYFYFSAIVNIILTIILIWKM